MDVESFRVAENVRIRCQSGGIHGWIANNNVASCHVNLADFVAGRIVLSDDLPPF